MDRSLGDIFQSIVFDVQEIVRAEIRLAKTEIRRDVTELVTSAGLVALSGALGAIGALFLLWSAAYALALVLPLWASVLIVGLVLVIAAAALFAIGRRRLISVQPLPDRTLKTMKENVEWVKQSSR